MKRKINEIEDNNIIEKDKEEINQESQKMELEKKFKEKKDKINEYYKDIQNLENYIQNIRIFINEVNSDISEIKNKINISIINYENILDNTLNDKKNIMKEIESLSNKVCKLSEIVEDIKNNKIKLIENIYDIIQNNLNEIEKMKIVNNITNVKKYCDKNNNIINIKLNELEQMIEELKKGRDSYENIKKEIEKEIEIIQNNTKKYSENTEEIHNTIVSSIKGEPIGSPKIEQKFLKGSMLLGIQDFENPTEIFNSKLLFNNNKINYQKQDLLRKNWREICYIYDDYDLHDINYELQAVGLPDNMFYNRCSVGFTIDRLIEIIEFEINGKPSQYTYNDYSLEFNIHLSNLESNYIHLKYKESRIKLTQGEKKGRQFYRTDYYGISKNLAGQTAIFSLILKCDFEIINFEDEIFAKVKEGEYKWGGEVPKEGKRVLIKMSKKNAKFDFYLSQRIESLDGKPIKNTILKIPFCFEGGNNEIKKLTYLSYQTNKYESNEDKKEYEIKFINTNKDFGEFIIKGELVNKCKGEWDCNLTNKQIEDEIPKDYKYNKEKFKEIALKIIDNYDKEHKNDIIQVTDLVKIGKWVKNKIKYDINYIGKNEISATEVYNNGAGVCHHFTKLYNALMYSLGYQCIYVSGYACEKKDNFDKSNAHAWSLIKINDKWLPFDSTWGIFSGKLPACHIFNTYFSRLTRTNGSDNIKIIESQIKGKFLG